MRGAEAGDKSPLDQHQSFDSIIRFWKRNAHMNAGTGGPSGPVAYNEWAKTAGLSDGEEPPSFAAFMAAIDSAEDESEASGVDLERLRALFGHEGRLAGPAAELPPAAGRAAGAADAAWHERPEEAPVPAHAKWPQTAVPLGTPGPAGEAARAEAGVLEGAVPDGSPGLGGVQHEDGVESTAGAAAPKAIDGCSSVGTAGSGAITAVADFTIAASLSIPPVTVAEQTAPKAGGLDGAGSATTGALDGPGSAASIATAAGKASHRSSGGGSEPAFSARSLHSARSFQDERDTAEWTASRGMGSMLRQLLVPGISEAEASAPDGAGSAGAAAVAGKSIGCGPSTGAVGLGGVTAAAGSEPAFSARSLPSARSLQDEGDAGDWTASRGMDGMLRQLLVPGISAAEAEAVVPEGSPMPSTEEAAAAAANATAAEVPADKEPATKELPGEEEEEEVPPAEAAPKLGEDTQSPAAELARPAPVQAQAKDGDGGAVVKAADETGHLLSTEGGIGASGQAAAETGTMQDDVPRSVGSIAAMADEDAGRLPSVGEGFGASGQAEAVLAEGAPTPSVEKAAAATAETSAAEGPSVEAAATREPRPGEEAVSPVEGALALAEAQLSAKELAQPAAVEEQAALAEGSLALSAEAAGLAAEMPATGAAAAKTLAAEEPPVVEEETPPPAGPPALAEGEPAVKEPTVQDAEQPLAEEPQAALAEGSPALSAEAAVAAADVLAAGAAAAKTLAAEEPPPVEEERPPPAGSPALAEGASAVPVEDTAQPPAEEPSPVEDETPPPAGPSALAKGAPAVKEPAVEDAAQPLTKDVLALAAAVATPRTSARLWAAGEGCGSEARPEAALEPAPEHVMLDEAAGVLIVSPVRLEAHAPAAREVLVTPRDLRAADPCEALHAVLTPRERQPEPEDSSEDTDDGGKLQHVSTPPVAKGPSGLTMAQEAAEKVCEPAVQTPEKAPEPVAQPQESPMSISWWIGFLPLGRFGSSSTAESTKTPTPGRRHSGTPRTPERPAPACAPADVQSLSGRFQSSPAGSARTGMKVNFSADRPEEKNFEASTCSSPRVPPIQLLRSPREKLTPRTQQLTPRSLGVDSMPDVPWYMQCCCSQRPMRIK